MPVIAATEFESHRRHLFGVAYRMLGSAADAEDAVQETWLRLRRGDQAEILDLRAWLTTVVSRICLDQLRSARVRREAYVGPWLPEPIVTAAPDDGLHPVGGPDPASAIELTESVRMALLVVLEELSPEQRVAFVLHDIFTVPYDNVAETLGCSVPAARQLASRARRIVADAKPPERAPQHQQRRVAEEFLRACATGDLRTLTELLHPDVIAHGDGGGLAPAGRRPVVGAEKVARLLVGLFKKYTEGATIKPIGVNGDLGMLVFGPSVPTDVTTFALDESGRIIGIFNQVNPNKLRGAGVVEQLRG
ncbi:sigma-70 family RNA polymerase sigma factor [Fodinicola feengrottensis]|uniref:sigma-70 family RNA polymerase sigma factor n=1 Tax=Fodinicola feengrottensis TaxID=435914 RepID=UPI0031CFDCD6